MSREKWPSDPRTPHLRWDRDPRNGQPRCYYRNREVAGSAQVRLRETFGSDAFVLEYNAAHAGALAGTTPARPRVEKVARRSNPTIEPKAAGVTALNYLLMKYYESPAFTQELGNETQRQRRNRLDKLCARDFESAVLGKVKLGELPYARLSVDFLTELQDDYADKPSGANALMKDLRAAFKWALKRKSLFPGLTHNPAVGIEPFGRPNAANGWRQWSVAEVHRFLEHYAGQRPAEWLTILLYTGARRSNATLLTDDMVMDGIHPTTGAPCKMLVFTVEKNRLRKLREGKEPVVIAIPILPALQACISNMKRPHGERHWLLSWHGRPYDRNDSFTHALASAAKAIGIKGSPHGLRKLGAALAAENGASHADMMAIFGWETMNQPDLYIRKFQRKRAALRAMHMVELPEQKVNAASPTVSRRQSHSR